MYKCVDEKGRTSYQSQPCDDGSQSKSIDTRYFNQEGGATAEPQRHNLGSNRPTTQYDSPDNFQNGTPGDTEEPAFTTTPQGSPNTIEAGAPRKVGGTSRTPRNRPRKPKTSAGFESESYLRQSMRDCDDKISLIAIAQVTQHPYNPFEVDTLIELTMNLYRHGRRNEAAFWYNAARLRAEILQVVNENEAQDAIHKLPLSFSQLADKYAHQNFYKTARNLEQILDWNKITPNPELPETLTKEQHQAIEKIYQKIKSTRERLIANIDKTRGGNNQWTTEVDDSGLQHFDKWLPECRK